MNALHSDNLSECRIVQTKKKLNLKTEKTDIMKGITQTIKSFLIGLGLFYIAISILLLVFRIPGAALLIGFLAFITIGFIAIILIKLFVPAGTNTGIDKVQVYAKGVQDFLFRTGRSLKTIFKESKALSLIGLTLLIIFCYKFVKQDLKDNKGLIGITLTTLTGNDSLELSDLSKYEFYNPFGNGGKMTEKERAKMALKQYNAETERMREERKNSIWDRILYGDQSDDNASETTAENSKKTAASDQSPSGSGFTSGTGDVPVLSPGEKFVTTDDKEPYVDTRNQFPEVSRTENLQVY